MWQSLPEFGSVVLLAILVVSAYGFAQAAWAIHGPLRHLVAARQSAYAACALVGVALALLSYAFVTHDFRIRYVTQYSARSMPTLYLLAALWGGQDGSLLFWAALLAGYSATCLWWIRGRYRQLEPIVIATLMSTLGFFTVLMVFAVNPFQVNLMGPVADGQGLNPLLLNRWMAIHPPMLYLGFVGCSIPFAFAIAALVSGRLDNEWITAVRKWMLVAWLALSIGNVLGMVWAYEELGWGGFWAWDPVENASVLPWFTATAFLHSMMIQERRGMFKVWNLLLVCLTFFLTIFGTFLTRSGLVHSVHSFAQSSVGGFFLWFMAGLVAICAALIVWRLPLLRSPTQIEAVLSRETTFVANNWALVGLMVFVAMATVFPKLSEWVYQQTITVGPRFFNRWAAPIGLTIYLLMGLCPLFGWRKSTGQALRRAFLAPGLAALVAAILHAIVGHRFGVPAILRPEPSTTLLGSAVNLGDAATPLVVVSLTALNVVVVVQEFVLGLRARRAASSAQEAREGWLASLFLLVRKNPRRYGGYVVHLGIVCAFLGFLGTMWSVSKEVSLAPGESTSLGRYSITYLRPRICPGSPGCSLAEQADRTKQMFFAEMALGRGQDARETLSPAKFVYQSESPMTTTEVGLSRGLWADVYVVLGALDSASGRAQLQIRVNLLVSWIWIGMLVVMLGATIALWPEGSLGHLRVWRSVRSSLANRTVEAESRA
jgi:cytochrome c-type biogenesis protein CcmF